MAENGHGGNRRYWAKQFDLDETELVDLSTGINPHGWPVPELPAEVWQRLPEESPQLLQAATGYYGSDQLLVVAGSQAAIQTLPRLRPLGRVGVLAPAYFEHRRGWEMAGHQVVEVAMDQIEQQLSALDVLVVVTPNNPTAIRFSRAQLHHWHQQLVVHGGWLVVDEAFIDTTPEQSLIEPGPVPTGLIVLRSLGKFFGLAGIRCGFVWASEPLRQRLATLLGPWALSHPAQWLATEALEDCHWQQQMRQRLMQEGKRLADLLQSCGLQPSGGTALFQWVQLAAADEWWEQLLQRGVLVRRFEQPASLRFGLPADESEWQQLGQVLQQVSQLVLQQMEQRRAVV